MKKFLLIACLSLTLFSCSESTEQLKEPQNLETSLRQPSDALEIKNYESGESLYVFFDSDEQTPIQLSKPATYHDAERSRPVAVAYWECAPGVYTNGANTYSIQIVGCETPNSYMYLDHFSQSVFCVTTSWGGSCS